jgi:MalT-like TPR region
MRLDEAAKAAAQIKRLLSSRCSSYAGRYDTSLGILEASIHAVREDFTAARRALMGVALGADDTIAATLLRYLNWRYGDHEARDARDGVDYLAAPVGGKAICRILSLCVSAAFAFDRLQLAVSANLATEALELARARYGNHSPMSTLPATLLAQVAYEQGHLDEAETLLRPRISIIRASGVPECVLRASVLLARLSLHRGRHRAALAILRETEALGRSRGWPRLASSVSCEYNFALETLRYDDIRGPESRRTGIPPDLLTCGEFDTQTSHEDLTFPAVQAALHRACLGASHGFNEDACRRLIPWLRIGAGRGLRMVFLDAGRPLLALLERLYYALPTDDPRLSDLRPYVATLLRSTIRSNTETSSSVASRNWHPAVDRPRDVEQTHRTVPGHYARNSEDPRQEYLRQARDPDTRPGCRPRGIDRLSLVHVIFPTVCAPPGRGRGPHCLSKELAQVRLIRESAAQRNFAQGCFRLQHVVSRQLDATHDYECMR